MKHTLLMLMLIPIQAAVAVAATTTGFNFNNSQRKRDALKQNLICACREKEGLCTPQIRRDIESMIGQLAPLNPTSNSARSPLLKREWKLRWTSEKEINLFLTNGWSNDISQTIIEGNGGASKLQNNISFVRGGFFSVAGEVNTDSELRLRTNFEFREATLDLARWGRYRFPPVGKGWFDTIYLDSSLRIDTNSRGDILICESCEN
ncbi:hypothetical protein THAOC_37612 [Thalassiosira oceanica]|uniref:Plastid lipid-associated protein/fibrillin conserved domain-containing protein n=1 Tax=Thalassiosira oceanica TaxID=159749 RepID=K0QY93_THAOC|nr:hypothetical protein THAOC_37612 [Thalassiosira oceanica]|eukprot:EJK43898.1 hypothetical protein THAOC_37612 [Thalassiosira oceanica]